MNSNTNKRSVDHDANHSMLVPPTSIRKKTKRPIEQTPTSNGSSASSQPKLNDQQLMQLVEQKNPAPSIIKNNTMKLAAGPVIQEAYSQGYNSGKTDTIQHFVTSQQDQQNASLQQSFGKWYAASLQLSFLHVCLLAVDAAIKMKQEATQSTISCESFIFRDRREFGMKDEKLCAPNVNHGLKKPFHEQLAIVEKDSIINPSSEQKKQVKFTTFTEQVSNIANVASDLFMQGKIKKNFQEFLHYLVHNNVPTKKDKFNVYMYKLKEESIQLLATPEQKASINARKKKNLPIPPEGHNNESSPVRDPDSKHSAVSFLVPRKKKKSTTIINNNNNDNYNNNVHNDNNNDNDDNNNSAVEPASTFSGDVQPDVPFSAPVGKIDKYTTLVRDHEGKEWEEILLGDDEAQDLTEEYMIDHYSNNPNNDIQDPIVLDDDSVEVLHVVKSKIQQDVEWLQNFNNNNNEDVDEDESEDDWIEDDLDQPAAANVAATNHLRSMMLQNMADGDFNGDVLATLLDGRNDHHDKHLVKREALDLTEDADRPTLIPFNSKKNVWLRNDTTLVDEQQLQQHLSQEEKIGWGALNGAPTSAYDSNLVHMKQQRTPLDDLSPDLQFAFLADGAKSIAKYVDGQYTKSYNLWLVVVLRTLCKTATVDLLRTTFNSIVEAAPSLKKLKIELNDGCTPFGLGINDSLFNESKWNEFKELANRAAESGINDDLTHLISITGSFEGAQLYMLSAHGIEVSSTAVASGNGN